MTQHDEPRDPLLVFKLMAAWTIVGVPLLWGVSQVVAKTLALFE